MFWQIPYKLNNLISLHILKIWPLIHQVLIPRQKGELLHVLVWQFHPSCCNNAPRFGEAALWCRATCEDAKVFPGGLCHDRISKRRLGTIFERERFGRRFHSFRVEVVHFMFYLVYSFLRQWLASSTGSDVPGPHKVTLTKAWIGASQGSLGHALLPSGASSSLSSSLVQNKCGPPPPSRFSLPFAFAC